MTTEDAPRAGRREWIGLAVIALPCMLYSMDLTVLNLAVPSLTADLKPTAAQLLWIVDIYGFFVAGALLTMGTLGDRIGRRKLLLIGAACFGAASIFAAFAQSAAMLILARALLGIAGATLAPSTLSLITNMFPNDRERTFAISVWVASFSVGGALGPVIGGALLAWFWWGSVFLIAVPVMVLLLVLAPRLLPEYKDPNPGRLDLLSAAMSVVAVLAIIYGIKQVAEGGDGWAAAATIAFGLVVGAVFVRRKATLEQPLLDLSLFGRPMFSAALAINVFGFFAAFGALLFIAQYLQLVLGLTPFEAGLWTLPSGLGFVAGSLLTSVLLGLMRPAYVLGLGLSVAAAGYFLLTQLDGPNGFALLITGFVMLSLGTAPCAAVAADLVMSAAPPDRAGAASGLNETSSEFGGALGIALLGSLVTVLYRAGLGASLPADMSPDLAATALRGIGPAAAIAEAMPGPSGAALLEAARDAFTQAMQITASVSGAVVLAAAVTAIVMFRKQRPAVAPV
ncbi:MFS transporter [Devosia nitrariae]|uniref:MFS transporter n=1 Tax=Devosia nitrariae TaxID=2071872 RepID=A0ABQ5W2S2_9HYPH|nr:MFS transporter [Devosia nitrariae]GLQ54001.1 MFS transporter [Devosia nitrariae]